MPDPTDAPLDFDRADFSAQSGRHAAPVCDLCSSDLRETYYTRAGQMLCEPCYFGVRDAGPPGSVATRALGALGLGVLAAIVAGSLWLLVTKLTGYEIGLIAIVVGLLVGGAVRLGGRRVGGVGYQLLAIALTYSAIVMTYVPSIVEGLRSNDELVADLQAGTSEADGRDAEAGVPDPAALDPMLYAVAIPIAFMAPFLMGFDNAIGILIIGFALYEAWKLNKRVVVELKGPFRLGREDRPGEAEVSVG